MCLMLEGKNVGGGLPKEVKKTKIGGVLDGKNVGGVFGEVKKTKIRGGYLKKKYGGDA